MTVITYKFSVLKLLKFTPCLIDPCRVSCSSPANWNCCFLYPLNNVLYIYTIIPINDHWSLFTVIVARLPSSYASWLLDVLYIIHIHNNITLIYHVLQKIYHSSMITADYYYYLFGYFIFICVLISYHYNESIQFKM